MFSKGAARLAGLAGALMGWRPDEFWAATPAELAAVLGALVGVAPASVTHDELGDLMMRFPDGQGRQEGSRFALAPTPQSPP